MFARRGPALSLLKINKILHQIQITNIYIYDIKNDWIINKKYANINYSLISLMIHTKKLIKNSRC